MFAFAVGSIFTDVNKDKFVEEAWEEFPVASEEVAFEMKKNLLYALDSLLGLPVLCLCVWMIVQFCFFYHICLQNS